jgi:hypothetical protein
MRFESKRGPKKKKNMFCKLESKFFSCYFFITLFLMHFKDDFYSWWTSSKISCAGSHTERWWRCSETGFPSRGRKNRQRLISVWHATHPLSHPRCKTLSVKKAGNTISTICRLQNHPNTQIFMITNTSSHSLIHQSHIVAYKSPQQHTPVCLINELMQWQVCVMELVSIQRMWWRNDGCLAVPDFPPIPKYSDYHIL